ncbi:hypothetical protein C7271_19220 [filamentous cyanobacterium CCP5]|nr:hypothetical protein C7271_19220 [filamentous cyanobacterium CCP5]
MGEAGLQETWIITREAALRKAISIIPLGRTMSRIRRGLITSTTVLDISLMDGHLSPFFLDQGCQGPYCPFIYLGFTKSFVQLYKTCF